MAPMSKNAIPENQRSPKLRKYLSIPLAAYFKQLTHPAAPRRDPVSGQLVCYNGIRVGFAPEPPGIVFVSLGSPRRNLRRLHRRHLNRFSNLPVFGDATCVAASLGANAKPKDIFPKVSPNSPAFNVRPSKDGKISFGGSSGDGFCHGLPAPSS